MPCKILVIEDEEPINELICLNLETAGYEPVPFFDGAVLEGHLREISTPSYDLALLDVMLPGRDGFELLPELQAHRIPVIFLTARGDLHSKVKGLTDGAEDYIVKPFEMLELLVRVEKVLNRFQKKVEDCYRIRDVEILPKERIVRKAGTVIPFKPMEFDCLLLLVRYKNIALSREQLLQMLWGVEFDGETRTIDVHVGRIRKKLGFQEVIKTVPRIGYRLEDRPEEEQAMNPAANHTADPADRHAAGHTTDQAGYTDDQTGHHVAGRHAAGHTADQAANTAEGTP